MNSWPASQLTTCTLTDCTLPDKQYNSGTGLGQSEKSGTVPDVLGQLGTMHMYLAWVQQVKYMHLSLN